MNEKIFTLYKKVLIIRKNLSIKNKLAIFFCFLLIVPIILISIFNYNYFIIQLQNRSISYMSEIQKLILERIDKYIAEIDSTALNISYSDEIQTFLNTKNVSPVKSREISNRIFTKIVNSPNVESVCIYSRENNIYVYKQLLDVNYDHDPGNEKWYKMVKQTERKPVLLGTHFDKQVLNENLAVLTIARNIYDILDYSNLGVIAVNMNFDIIADLCKDMLKKEGLKLYVIDKRGYIIYSNDKSKVMKTLDKNLFNRMGDTNGSFFTKIGNKVFVAYDTSKYTDWIIITTIPFRSFIKERNSIKFIIFFVVLLISLFLVFIIYYFSKKIMLPLKKIENFMEDAEENNFSAKLEVSTNDEIGHISHNFNKFMDKIRTLLNKVKAEEELIRKTEISLLQSQINPHFLYNTLNTIKWMATIQKSDNIAKIIDDLVNLLRYTSKSQEQLVTLKDELYALEKYIEIQKIRYYDKFEVAFDIDAELLNYKVLKFTFQPIVENAILYAFEGIEYKGQLDIKIEKEKSLILCSINDNGVGMNKRKLKNVLIDGGNKKKGNNKIGLNNVNKRIKLYFGEKYGIKIESKTRAGTNVLLSLPMIL